MAEFNITMSEIEQVKAQYRAEYENAYDDFLAFNNSNNADKLTEI